MKNPLLTIAIPTYNRPLFLDKALEGIAEQITPEMEIVISDDGSKDNTEEIVKGWQTKLPNQIIYYKKPVNERFDKNLITAIEKASGEYCWFMSDDDMLVPGAIKRVIDELKSDNKDKFILLNYSRFDNDAQKVTIERMMEFNDRSFTLEEFLSTKSPNSFFDFFGKNIIYMSVFIFPRKYWLKYVDECKKYSGINFIHCFVFLHILKKENLPIRYISKPYVLYRSGNIRAWGNNIWKDFNNKFLGEALAIGVSRKIIKKMQYAYRFDQFRIKAKAAIRKIWK